MTTRHPDLSERRARVVVPLILALLSMLGPFSIDTPFPAFAEMARDLAVGSQELQLVVTAYMLAFAAMSLFHGPISDAVGRRPVMAWSIAVYVVGSVGCAVAPSLEWLLAGRVLQGLSAGGATIVSRTVVRDLFEGAEAQRLMSRVAIIFGVAPAVAPVVGGALLQLGPWPLVFAFQAVLGLALILAVLLVLPETHPVSARVPMRVGEVVRGLGEVARRPAFHRVAWAGTLGFGAQFLYIGGAAIFVVELLGLGELDFWVLFVPMIALMMLGSWVAGRTAGRVSARRIVSTGYTVSVVGGVVGVVLAAGPWAAVPLVAVVGPALLALGNGMSYPVLQLLIQDLFPRRRGAAVSGWSFVALTFNALAAAALTPYVAESLLGLAVTALVLVAAGHLCWTWHGVLEDREAATVRRPDPLEPTDLV